MWTWIAMSLPCSVARADDEGWAVRAELGGQFEQSSHGIANVIARRGGVELALITDTVQVRYDGALPRGRWWVAGRGQAGAAGLVSTRWIDGVPSPEASQLGFYAGPEGGVLVYGPRGTYAGLQAAVRYYAFAALPRTAEVAPARLVGQPEAVFGWWTEEASLYVRAGVAVMPDTVSPGVHGAFELRPAGRFSPRFEIRAGVAENTDLVTAVRLGGMNPYVVPLLGAAWAEFWVEDYAAIRAGQRFGFGRHWVQPTIDAAWFDGRAAAGVGGYAQLGFTDAVALVVGVGVAPAGVPRATRSWAGSSYALLTADF